MQIRADQVREEVIGIRQEIERLLTKAEKGSSALFLAEEGSRALFLQAERLLSDIPIKDYTNKDWFCMARVHFGKGMSSDRTSDEYVNNLKLARDILLTIPALTSEMKSLLVQCSTQYFGRVQFELAIFPTNKEKFEYLGNLIKLVSDMKPQAGAWYGFQYLAEAQQKMGQLFVLENDYLNAKAFYNAALVTCKQNGPYASLMDSIYSDLAEISFEYSLEKSLYFHAADVFHGQHYHYVANFPNLLKIHLAIVQQPHMHLTPAAHALLLFLQLYHQVLVKHHAESKECRTVKTLMDKLAADLKPVALQKFAAESGSFAVGVAAKLGALEEQIKVTQNQFALFTLQFQEEGAENKESAPKLGSPVN